MSFPINPSHGQVYSTDDGAVYTFEGSLKTWVQSITGRIPLKTATSLQAGAMSKEDFQKITRLVLPPPESTLTVDGCEYDRGYLEFASGDKNVVVKPKLAVQNVDEFGDLISKDFNFQIHEFTYGIDFSLDLVSLISEMRQLGRVVYDGYQGAKGDVGAQGPPGSMNVWAGPQGDDGARGLSAECVYSHSAETFAAVPVEDTNRVLTGARIDDDPTDVTKKILTFDRKVLGTLKPISYLTVSSNQSPWLMTFNTATGVNEPNYIDVDALVDNIHSFFESKLLSTKNSYESIVRSWIGQMSSTFDAQKAALTCALERCLSKNKNIDSRQHMESVAGSAVGKAKIILNDNSSGATVDGCTDPGSGWVTPPPPPTAMPTTPTTPTTTPTTPTTITPTTTTAQLIGYKLYIELNKLTQWWQFFNSTYCNIIKIQDADRTGNTQVIKDFVLNDIFIPISELELKTSSTGKNYFDPSKLTTLTNLQRTMKFFKVEPPRPVKGTFNNTTLMYDYPPLCNLCFSEGYAFGDFILDFYNNGDSLFETGPVGTYRLGSINLNASISSFCNPNYGGAEVYPNYVGSSGSTSDLNQIGVRLTPVYGTITTPTTTTPTTTTPTTTTPTTSGEIYSLYVNVYQAVYDAFKKYNDTLWNAADKTKCKPVDLNRINENDLKFTATLTREQVVQYKIPDSNYLSNTAPNAGPDYLSTYFSQIGSLSLTFSNGNIVGGQAKLWYQISGNCKTPDVISSSGTRTPGQFIKVSPPDPDHPIVIPVSIQLINGMQPTTPTPTVIGPPTVPNAYPTTPTSPNTTPTTPNTPTSPRPPTTKPLPTTPNATPTTPNTTPTTPTTPLTPLPPVSPNLKPPPTSPNSPPPKPTSVRYYLKIFSGDLVDFLLEYGFDFTSISTVPPVGAFWQNYWESEHTTFDGLLPRTYPKFWGLAQNSLTGWTKVPDKGYREAKVTITQFHDSANVKSTVDKNLCSIINTNVSCTMDLVLSGAYGKPDYKKSFTGTGLIWTKCTFATPTMPTTPNASPTTPTSGGGWRALSVEDEGVQKSEAPKVMTVPARNTIPYPVHVDSAYVNSIINSYKLNLPAGSYVATIKVADAKVGNNYRSNVKFTYFSNGKKKYSSFIFKGEFDDLADSRDVYEGLAVSFSHSGGTTEWWLSIEPGLMASGVVSIAVTQEELFMTQSAIYGYCSMSLQDVGAHQNAWQTQQCDGCVINMLGQDYAVMAIDSDNECYKMFRQYGKVAFAFPTFNGVKLLSKDRDMVFKYEQNVSAKALDLINSGKYFRQVSKPDFDVVLFQYEN